MPQKSNIIRIPKKGSNSALIFLLVLFVAFVIGLGFFMSKGKNTENKKVIGGPETNINKELNVQLTNESEKEEKKEKKKEKKEEQKTTSYSGDYFFVDYPEDWQTKKVNGATVSFSSPDKKTNGLGEISISYKENKKNLPIERFYDGITEINLFEDAAGGFEKTTISGQEAYKFKNLVGETPSTVLVIKSGKAFIEISDNYNAHQNDGIFDGFVGSVKVK